MTVEACPHEHAAVDPSSTSVAEQSPARPAHLRTRRRSRPSAPRAQGVSLIVKSEDASGAPLPRRSCARRRREGSRPQLGNLGDADPAWSSTPCTPVGPSRYGETWVTKSSWSGTAPPPRAPSSGTRLKAGVGRRRPSTTRRCAPPSIAVSSPAHVEVGVVLVVDACRRRSAGADLVSDTEGGLRQHRQLRGPSTRSTFALGERCVYDAASPW
jgi:hypothetical protein